MRRYVVVSLGLAVALAACGKSEDLKQVRESQQKLEAKIGELEKKLAQAPPAAARPQADPNKVYDLPVGKSAVKGPADASVTLVEFSDFQCPFCGRATPLIDQAIQAYPKDLKFVYKELPLPMHANAMPASRAAIAAQRQGKYWEMHDKLFANQRALQPDNFKQYAQELGLDVPKFEQDMSSPDVQGQITEDMQLARQSGVRGTPTLFVNGKQVQNNSFEGLKQMIDEALQKKS